jgi:Rha family phage regulatory protein
VVGHFHNKPDTEVYVMARASVSKDELVVIQNGQPFTTSILIAEKFGKRHDFVLRKIESLPCSEAFHSANFAESSYLAENGKQEKAYLVTEEGFMFIAMRFTGPEAVKWQETFIGAFQKMRRELERLARQQRDPDWRQLRDKTKVGYEWMSRTLQERREAAGKATKPHHYMNEARLVSAVLSGRFEGMNRNTLTTAELDLVSDLQRLNAILIGQDLPYAKRKEILMDRSITKIPEIREPAGSYLLS